MSNKFFSIFFISVLASLVPYLACQFFDSPLLHGFISAEEFFLLLALVLPSGKIFWKLPFVFAIFAYALYDDSIAGFAVAGVYLLIFLIASFIPRQKRYLLPVFVVFSLFLFIADCGNFFYSTFVLKFSDVWGLAKFFWWGPVLFIVLPAGAVAFQYFYARKILWGDNRLELPPLVAIVILAVSIGLNLGINQLQHRQPIMDFPVKTWFWHLFTPGLVGQNSHLQDDIKAEFSLWPKDEKVIDYNSKTTVVVLVESYGVNKSIAYTQALLAPFAFSNVSFIGLYLRNSSHTQGAEWEDFDAPGGSILEKTLPSKYKDKGFQTWYLHGYDGNFYTRSKNYSKFGFDSLLFRNDFENRNFPRCRYGFVGICDSSVIDFIDSLVTDSVPKFIYWTTLDAHPPYELSNIKEKSPKCESLSLSDIDCTYFTLQENTMNKLAKLIKKHPDCVFVVRGDHRPMGSVSDVDFVQSFYFRWVPLIVLNR